MRMSVWINKEEDNVLYVILMQYARDNICSAEV